MVNPRIVTNYVNERKGIKCRRQRKDSSYARGEIHRDEEKHETEQGPKGDPRAK